MRADVYREVRRERNSWMKQRRRELVATLIERHGPREPGAVLAVGAGLGQNVPALRRFGPVDAIEPEPIALALLRQQPGLREVFTERVPFPLARSYGVICALELLEHLPDDRAALAWMSDRLVPGGALVLTVPAYSWLFSDHDRALGHQRRYTRASLLAAMPPDLQIAACGYYNLLLFPAQVAQVAASALRRRSGPPAKLRVPHEGPLDGALSWVLGRELALIRRGLVPPAGGGVYCVARRR